MSGFPNTGALRAPDPLDMLVVDEPACSAQQLYDLNQIDGSIWRSPCQDIRAAAY
jgi:hypothetical protein